MLSLLWGWRQLQSTVRLLATDTQRWSESSSTRLDLSEQGLRPHLASSYSANTDVKLALGQLDLWQKQSPVWNKAVIKCIARCLEYKLLICGHNLSRTKKQYGNRRWNILLTLSIAKENLNQNMHSRKKKGCLREFNKDTWCLTGLTWQLLPCGVSAISCKTQTLETNTSVLKAAVCCDIWITF